MNKSFFFIIQIVLSILLAVLILIQSKGSGLSPLGGKIGIYSTKRGIEKLFFNLTIILAVLFFVSSLVQLIV